MGLMISIMRFFIVSLLSGSKKGMAYCHAPEIL